MEILENYFGSNFDWSDVEYNTSRLLHRSPNRSPKVLRAKFLGSDGLFHFISSKFGSFKNLFAMICKLVCKLMILQLACLDFTLDAGDLRSWFKQKVGFFELWQQRTENHGEEWGLILTMRDTCINSILNPLTKSQTCKLSRFSRETPGLEVWIYMLHDF